MAWREADGIERIIDRMRILFCETVYRTGEGNMELGWERNQLEGDELVESLRYLQVTEREADCVCLALKKESLQRVADLLSEKQWSFKPRQGWVLWEAKEAQCRAPGTQHELKNQLGKRS